jgi:hypothetical protein
MLTNHDYIFTTFEKKQYPHSFESGTNQKYSKVEDIRRVSGTRM